jgi:hypothetical protein
VAIRRKSQSRRQATDPCSYNNHLEIFHRSCRVLSVKADLATPSVGHVRMLSGYILCEYYTLFWVSMFR